jgi:hypothetical protein
MCRLELGEGNGWGVGWVDLIPNCHPFTARLSQMSERCSNIEDIIFLAILMAKPRGVNAVPCVCICVAFVYDEFFPFWVAGGGV